MSDPTRRRPLERGPDGKPTFVYTPHDRTDVAATWERVRQEQARQHAPAVVKQIRRKA